MIQCRWLPSGIRASTTMFFFLMLSLSFHGSSSLSYPDDAQITTASSHDILPASSLHSSRYDETKEDNDAPIPRALTVGDFAIVNEVFRDLEVPIPIDDPIDVGAGFTVMLQNLVCRNLDIGDVQLQYTQPSDTSVVYKLDVIQFDAECSFDYEYEGPLGTGGRSSGNAKTSDNFFSADLTISQSAVAIPPDGFDISNCKAGINMIDLAFQGGVVAYILDLIDPLIRGTIQKKVEEFVCQYVTGLKDEAKDVLGQISAFLNPYLEPVDAVDPLVPEVAYNASVNGNWTGLVNFLQPKTTVEMVVDVVLEKANSLLGAMRDDANAPSGTGQDLGINVIIRDFILDKDRAFEFKTAGKFLNNGVIFNTTAAEMAELVVRIERVKLQGLDTFTRFDPFKKLGDYTLNGSFAWESTTIEADVYISLGPPGSDEKVEETITVYTSAKDLEFSFAAFVGIDEKRLGALNIGDILNSQEILPCLASVIEVANITSLILSVGTVEHPVIDDFESPGLGRVLESGFNGLYELLDDFVLVAIPGLFQTTVREFLNDEISTLKDGSECNPVKALTESGLVDFRDLFLPPSVAKSLGGSGTEPYGDIGGLLRTVIDDLLVAVNPDTGRPKVNEELIAPLTAFQSGVDGTLRFDKTLVSLTGDLEVGTLDATIAIEVSGAVIENLDTVWDPLVLIEPTSRSPNEVDNNITFGLADKPVRSTFRLLVAVEGVGDMKVKDEVDITLNLVEARTTTALLARIVASKALTLPLSELLNIHCWLATVPVPKLDAHGVRLDSVERSLGLAEVMVVFQNLFVNVTCVECTSPGMQQLSDLLLTEDASIATTKAANDLFQYVTSLLDGEFVQIFIDRLVNAAPARCPGNPEYDPNFQGLKFKAFDEVDTPSDSITFLLAVGLSTGGLILCFVLIRYIVKCVVNRRHQRWLASLPHEKVYRIYREQKREDEKATFLRETTSSIFQSTNIPLSVRYSIPVVILANIALFLSGHLSIGGSVSVFITFAEEDIVIKDFFVFSVAESTIQLYEAGGWQLALLILLFSGIWPYTKQIITLVCWFLPPRLLAAQRRGSIFLWLDTLAKWSSADIFFLIVSLAAFNISIQSPDVPFLPDDFYSVKIMLTPLWGLYANLIAQLFSQVSSHIIIHYHRKIVNDALALMANGEQQLIERSADDEMSSRPSTASESVSDIGPTEKLYEHGFTRPHRGLRDTITPRQRVSVVLVGISVVLVILIIAGCSVTSFSFEQLGLLGVAVELGKLSDKATTEFGVFTIAKTLIDQGRFLGTVNDQIGLGVIASLMIVTIVIVPVVQVCALVYQWLGSLTETARGKLEVFIEILSAWQYVEVYLLAVMISVWQLGPTSEFLINAYCSRLKDTFSSLVFYGVLSEEDAQCFRLRGSVNEGCYILIAAAFALFFVHNIVTRAVLQYQRDKDEAHRAEFDGYQEEPDAMTQRMMETMTIEEVMEKVHAPPVLFTDSYRWLLVSSSPAPLGAFEDVDYEMKPEQPWKPSSGIQQETIESGDSSDDDNDNEGKSIVESLAGYGEGESISMQSSNISFFRPVEESVSVLSGEYGGS